jgi:hypothetical protein
MLKLRKASILGSQNYLLEHQISKKYSPSFHGIYKIVTFKYESFFLGVFLTFMKIRCSSPFFRTFGNSFQIKLIKHGSILIFRFEFLSD